MMSIYALKPKFQNLLRPLVRRLYQKGVTANQVTLAACAVSGAVGLLLSLPQAFAFCERSEAAVAGGRPLCRWCQFPIDPDGHICPRMN